METAGNYTIIYYIYFILIQVYKLERDILDSTVCTFSESSVMVLVAVEIYVSIKDQRL